MGTHPAVAGFDRDAGAYERGRPGYPAAVIDHLAAELSLGPPARVLDLGAGTGKFTRALVGSGARLIGVEPTAAMRRLFRELTPRVPIVAALAERLPFRPATADAVVAAQAFHWFASPASLDELARVLRPGGGLGLVWNIRDERVPWAARLGEIINEYSGEIPRQRSGRWKSVFDGRDDFTRLKYLQFEHVHPSSVDTIVDRVLSISAIALQPADEQERIEQRVRRLLATDPATENRSLVPMPYVTDVYTAHRQ